MILKEARKFLTGKKVFVKNKGKEVQEKLFNTGFKWLAPNEKGVYKDRYFLFLYENLTLTYADEIEYFYNHKFEEISAEDILKLTKNIYRVTISDDSEFKISAIQKKTQEILHTLGIDLLRKK